MKKIFVTFSMILGTMAFIQCNNSATGETSSDTTSTMQTDTTKTQIVTEGGLKDSLQTGATDTSAKKDTIKK